MPALPLPSPRRSLAATALLGALLTPFQPAGAAATPLLDPDRVGWSEIRMTASRLFMTATADASLRLLPAPMVRDQLWPPPRGNPVLPGKSILEVSYEIGGLGRRSQVTLWMDPWTGAALQRHQHDMEGRQRFRTYRFTDQGAYQWTRRPTAGERAQPPGEWTSMDSDFRAYPPAAVGRVIVEPTGLLYAVAASAINQPGDELELIIFQRRSVQQVSVTVRDTTQFRLSYDEIRAGQTTRRSGSRPALRLTLRGETMDDAEEELELFGLRGALDLLLDPATRTPLQLSGDVKVVGRVNLRLAAVHLDGVATAGAGRPSDKAPDRLAMSGTVQRNRP